MPKKLYLWVALTVFINLMSSEVSPLPTWKQRDQLLRKQTIQKSFHDVTSRLQDLTGLEKDILSFGPKYGIKNWEFKWSEFKIKIGLIEKYVQDNFRVSSSGFNYSYPSNWLVILALLGLKPVTSEDFSIQADLLPYLNGFKQFKGLRYTINTAPSAGEPAMMVVGNPLIPLSKMMEWYDKKEFMGKSKIFNNFYQQLQSLQANDVQESSLDFLENWGKAFDKIREGYPENLVAVMLGYQPYAYERSKNDVWRAFYENQYAYRLLLNPEYVFLDDPTQECTEFKKGRSYHEIANLSKKIAGFPPEILIRSQIISFSMS